MGLIYTVTEKSKDKALENIKYMHPMDKLLNAHPDIARSIAIEVNNKLWLQGEVKRLKLEQKELKKSVKTLSIRLYNLNKQNSI